MDISFHVNVVFGLTPGTEQVFSKLIALAIPPVAVTETLARIESKLDAATTRESQQMSKMSDEVALLRRDVQDEKTINASAVTLLNGINDRIAAAVEAAKAAGATDEEVAAIEELRVGLASDNAALAKAVTDNTPAAAAALP